MSILLYRVENKNIIRSTDNTLNQESIYIIVDRSLIRPKIWVWSGSKSTAKDRYFAGVSATTIKSQEKLYGSSIEVVEGGSEPEQFPKLEEGRIIVPSAEEKEFIAQHTGVNQSDVIEPPEVIDAPEFVEPIEEGVNAGEPEVVKQTLLEKSQPVEMPQEIAAESPKKSIRKHTAGENIGDRLLKEKLKSFMMDLSRDLESVKNKVDAFIADL